MDETETADNLLPPPPERIGPYRLKDRLGVGGMGAVYRAYDERLERTVAVKHVLPEMADDARALKRLRREAKAIARINHPAVVQIYDIEEHESGDWIVMELVDGRTLHSLLEDGPPPLAKALDLLRQITAGLAAAHDQDVVHRDLKAENVMVTADGGVKILDFGLAKPLWRGADKSLSIEGSILGTGRSMSPEQALGEDVTPRSDLFSLGSLIYELVTGEPPFAGETIFKILAQICTDPHTPARAVNPALPEKLAALIDGLLEKDPEKRPASARQVLAALDAIEVPADQEGSAEAPGGDRDESPSGWQPPAPAAAGTAGRTGDDTLWMHPARRPGRQRQESSSGLYIRTLLRIRFQDPRPIAALGSQRGQLIVSSHDRLVRDLLAKSGGLEIDRFDDGFLLLFELPSEAVAYALGYRSRLAELRDQEGIELDTGVGIHLGELHMTENPPDDVSRGAKLLEVAGPAKLIAARVAALADDGQILITRMAYELARRAMIAGGEAPELDWAAHGRYRIQDTGEVQAIFEVAPPGATSSRPPADVPNVERVADAGDGGATRRPARRWRAAVAAAAAFLALVYLLGPGRKSGPTAPRPTMAVLGFKNLSERAETEWLSTALAELLAAELAAGGDLRMVPGEAVARMKMELALPALETLTTDTLRDIRRNLGTDHVLVGSYLALNHGDESLRLDLRLQPTGGGETLFVNATGSERELFDLVSDAALSLRQQLGLGMISSSDAAAIKATLGKSAGAHRLYSEGLARLRDHEPLAARDLLREAVEADPDYALAHAALSRAWSHLGYDAKARASASRAFELAKDLPAAAFLTIQGRFHEVTGEWDKAADTYRLLREYHPDDVDYALRQVEAQRRAGQVGEALATVESLRDLPPPASDDPRLDLAEAKVRASQSDYQGAIAAAERAIAAGTEREAWILVAEAQQSKWRPLRSLGRRDEARAALEESRRLFTRAGDDANVAEALSGIALLLEDQGHLSRAEGLYNQALEIHRRIGSQKGVADGLNNLADLVLDLGDLEKAQDMVGQAIHVAHEIGDRQREARFLDTQAWVLLRLGRLAEADARARDSLVLSEEIGQPEGVGWAHYYLGQVALARGLVQVAEERYQRVHAIGRELGSNDLVSFAHHDLARLRLEQGDLAAAEQAAAESRAAASELTPGESALLRCRLLLESSQLGPAVDAATVVARDLRAEARRDDEAQALALLATARLALRDLTTAREMIDRALAAAGDTRNPRLKLSLELVAGRVQAAGGDPGGARRRIETALREATENGFALLELEARLALGELELSAGAAGARERLEALAAGAAERGLGLVASKARRLLDGGPPARP